MTMERSPAEWLSRNSGQNFVFLHGLAMSPGFWRLYAPGYALKHNAVAYPLPGHHPWPLADNQILTTDRIVSAYAAAIEADFAGRPVTLVGHSTGGFVALLLAAERPDLIRSVVLLGGFACGRFEGRERMVARLLRIPAVGPRLFVSYFRHWISTRERFRYGSIDCVYDKSCPWETEQALVMMEEVRAQLQKARPEDIGALIAWFQRTSYLARLSGVTVPVLNMVGTRDAIVPPSHQMRLSRLLPNAQTVVFGNAGHLLMVERQGEFNRIFQRFAENPFLWTSSAKPRHAPQSTQFHASTGTVPVSGLWQRIPFLGSGTNPI